MSKLVQLKNNNENIFPISKPYKYISNNDGEAYKFYDGLLICVGISKNGTKNFPVEFINTPFISATPYNNQTTSMHFSQATATKTSISIVNGWASSGGSWILDPNVESHYIAIGKWK